MVPCLDIVCNCYLLKPYRENSVAIKRKEYFIMKGYDYGDFSYDPKM